MMRQLPPILLLLLVGLALVVPAGLRAQPLRQDEEPPRPEQVVIYDAALQPPENQQDTRPTLYASFAVMDSTGNPIQAPPIEEATITILDEAGNDQTFGATWGDPQSPIFIAMLLDTSGSMSGAIEAVRDAAIFGVHEAPANAHFSIYKFNERYDLLISDDSEDGGEGNFSTNLDVVRHAIETIAEPGQVGGATCLYDVTYQIANRLRRIEQTQGRRAIILFTDGVDEDRNRDPCSTRSLADVVREAQEIEVPIYTIGLCGRGTNDPCTDREIVNGEEVIPLQFMANQTKGLSTMTSNEGELSQHFEEIMNGLDSQLLARADTFVNHGMNQAVLEIKLEGHPEPLRAEFEFSSDAEYAPPPSILIEKSHYLNDGQLALNLNITRSEDINTIEIGIRPGGDEAEIDAQTFNRSEIRQRIENDTPFEVDTSQLEAGQEYCFSVRATDNDEQSLQAHDGIRGQNTTLAETCVTYDPRVTFGIRSVKADVPEEQLIITLDIDETDGLLYEVEILDEGTRQPVDHSSISEEHLLRTEQINLPLPPQMVRDGDKTSYSVTVILRKEGAEDKSEQTHTNFTVQKPGWFARLFNTVRNPWVLGIIGVIVLGVVGTMMYPRLRNKRAATPPPPFNPPTAFQEDTRVLVRIVETLDRTQQQHTEVFEDMHFTIGRGTEANIRITGDKNISRKHVRIEWDGNICMLVDLGSHNGTFIGKDRQQRLDEGESKIVVGPTIVWLGPSTQLEIEPHPQHTSW
jgi:hypothetical protein